LVKIAARSRVEKSEEGTSRKRGEKEYMGGGDD
jgi:hypothetical protein